MPANSFIATSEAVSAAGAKVVFIDCDPVSYCMDINKLEEKISPKTKAIIAVHLYGYPADMPTITKIANQHNLFIIEDAAQAHGAKIADKNIGSWGHMTSFSFYPGKTLGAYGDAGAIVTNDDVFSRKMRMFANHGRISKYDHEFEGINSRLDALQAAILNVKLKHLPKWIEQRRQVADRYRQLLGHTDLVLPYEEDGFYHTYHLFVIRVKNRENIAVALKQKGIDTGVHYPIGLPFLKAYQHLKHIPDDFPTTYQSQSQLLSLPIYPELTERQIQYVCEQLIAALQNK